MLVLFCELQEIGNVELFTMNGPMALLREWGNLLLRCNNADKERGSVGSFPNNRYKSTDEKPTNQSRLNPSKREYPRLNRKPQKARKNLVNHTNH